MTPHDCPETCEITAAAWRRVEAALKGAVAIHFDGCHKIYVATDEAQALKAADLGYATEAPNLELIQQWYEDSCSMRFISKVRTVPGPSGFRSSFTELIDQFELEFDVWEEDENEIEEDDTDTDDQYTLALSA